MCLQEQLEGWDKAIKGSEVGLMVLVDLLVFFVCFHKLIVSNNIKEALCISVFFFSYLHRTTMLAFFMTFGQVDEEQAENHARNLIKNASQGLKQRQQTEKRPLLRSYKLTQHHKD